ncbi:oligosaccharide flippase family protein [Vibrio diabolicus]|uniref:oligosaccharide flippase family protein n=1 Tax=Vibrio diabolicus TaxID=50719 RepID=UPI0037533187
MKLVKDSFLYLLGDILVKIIPFLLLPYLTNTLGSEDFGRLSLFQFYISFTSILFGATQGGILSKYYYKYGKKTIGLIVSNANFYSLFSSLLCSFVLYQIYNEEIYFLIIAIALTTELYLSQLTLRICQKNVKAYVVINVFYSATSIALTFTLFSLCEPSVEMRLIAMFVSNITWFFLALKFKTENIKYSFSFRKRKLGYLYLVSIAPYLMLIQFTALLKGQVDRLYINEYYSLNELGAYSAAYQLAVPFTMVILSLNKAIQPRYFQLLKNGKLNFSKVKSLSIVVLILSCVFSLVTILIPETVLFQILGIQDQNLKYFLVIFSIGNSTLAPYLLLTNYFVYVGKVKVVTISSISGLLIYFIYLSFFANKGIVYLPYGTLISNLFVSIVLYFCGGLTNVKEKKRIRV